MAEVKIQLIGENKVTPVLDTVFEKTRNIFGEMNTLMTKEAKSFQAIWQDAEGFIISAFASVMTIVKAVDSAVGNIHETVNSLQQKIRERIEFDFDTSRASKAVRDISSEIARLATPKTLVLDISNALTGVWRVKAALDSIPDVTTKTVIMSYKTQASPVMPFSEGIRYIKEKMESLPRESDYIFRSREVGMQSEHRTETAVHAPSQNITFSPTIHVNKAGEVDGVMLARELDSELARMWRYNRSELRKAVTV